MTGIRFIDAAELTRALPPEVAVEALLTALRSGLDPRAGTPRTFETLKNGELLLMPAESDTAAGIKVLTVAPDNPERGLPRIQGLYLLFDRVTLAPRALLDGIAVTNIRTPAVSFAAIRDAVLRNSEPLDVVLFGAGPQADAHLATLRAVLESRRPVASVSTIVRSPERVASALGAGSPEADAALRRAGLVICATTARTPLFDSHALRDDAVVVAIGSHDPDARELDSALMGRAQVIVEDEATALRECGDVVLAVADGSLDPAGLIPLSAVATGRTTLHARTPVVFKSSGMPWEDLVIAEAALTRL